MNFFEKQKNKKLLENILIEFAEGKISCEEFWKIYLENEQLQTLILKDKTRYKKYSRWFIYEKDGKIERVYKPIDSVGDYALENFPNVINLENLLDRVEVFNMVYRYFSRRKRKLSYKNSDSELWKRIFNLIPDWLLLVDGDYFVDLFLSIPAIKTEEERDELFQSKLNELFRYEQKPPEWIQNADWPMKNGVPLIFKKQIDTIKENENYYDEAVSKYYFYDPQTGEEVVIEQSDFA